MLKEKDALNYLRDQRITVIDGRAEGQLIDARSKDDDSIEVYVNDSPAYRLEVLITDLRTNRAV